MLANLQGSSSTETTQQPLKETKHARSEGADPASTPTKQERPKKSLPRSRHEDFYFDDGNIVLLAKRTYFKVHKGILSRHSTVFSDMFSDPQGQTKTYDNCTLYSLSDSCGDLEHILSALYDGRDRHQPIPFAKASAFLRLGDKYRITKLRYEAMRCFRDSFPTSKRKFDALFQAYRWVLAGSEQEPELEADHNGSESGSDSESKPEPASNSEPDPDSDTETWAEPESDTTESEPEPEPEPEPESESESDDDLTPNHTANWWYMFTLS